MRGEIITGNERRRRWSHEEKIAIVTEAFAPGAVVTEVARRHQVQSQQIYQWRDRILEERKANVVGEIGEFVPVKVTSPEAPAAKPDDITDKASVVTPITTSEYSVEFVLAGGRIMRVGKTVSCERLRDLIRLVEGA